MATYSQLNSTEHQMHYLLKDYSVILTVIKKNVVQEYLCSKLESKNYKLSTKLKSYKNEIKILANPGVA